MKTDLILKLNKINFPKLSGQVPLSDNTNFCTQSGNKCRKNRKHYKTLEKLTEEIAKCLIPQNDQGGIVQLTMVEVSYSLSALTRRCVICLFIQNSLCIIKQYCLLLPFASCLWKKAVIRPTINHPSNALISLNNPSIKRVPFCFLIQVLFYIWYSYQ